MDTIRSCSYLVTLQLLFVAILGDHLHLQPPPVTRRQNIPLAVLSVLTVTTLLDALRTQPGTIWFIALLSLGDTIDACAQDAEGVYHRAGDHMRVSSAHGNGIVAPDGPRLWIISLGQDPVGAT